jgi:polysaccharide biosynthesis/export protein
MQVSRWHSTPALLVLLLGVAFAQRNNVDHDSSDSSQNVNSEDGATSIAQTPANDPVVINVGSAAADQPAAQKGIGAASGSKEQSHTTAPFVEDYPPDPDAETEIPKARIPLPVILDSASPALDRSVKREDIQALPEDYVIGEEDMLTVNIWKERDLTGSVVVRPDGRITVPLIGEMKVVGMTPLQLQTQLEERLKPFITVPKVSVAVNQINSRKVYLIGQVVREGTFPINSSMTVLQVLAGAGGLRDFAKKKKIYILRKHGDEEIRFPFDYGAAIRGRNREENIRVEPGDTIVVP